MLEHPLVRLTDLWLSIWERLQRSTTLAWQACFQDKLRAFRQSRLDVDKQARPDTNIERWLEIKRNASGVILGFALIEYASDLVLSDSAPAKAALENLAHCASDVLVWYEVCRCFHICLTSRQRRLTTFQEIVSYNIRQARDDNSSLVTALSSAQNLPIQEAINLATTRAKDALSRFLAQEREVLETHADASTRRYVQGLRDCIIGFAHWVYETDAYFLGQGEDVRAFGWVFLLPKSDTDPVQQWISEQKKS